MPQDIRVVIIRDAASTAETMTGSPIRAAMVIQEGKKGLSENQAKSLKQK